MSPPEMDESSLCKYTNATVACSALKVAPHRLVRRQIAFEQLQRNCHKISICAADNVNMDLVRCGASFTVTDDDPAEGGEGSER